MPRIIFEAGPVPRDSPDQGRRFLLRRACGLLLATAASCSAPVSPMRFDEGAAVGLEAGCGGSPADWHISRSIEDPRDGALRSRPSTPRSCLLVPGSDLEDGAVAVSMTSSGGLAGIVLRYRDEEHYLGIEQDQNAGLLTVSERKGEDVFPLASARFERRPRIDLVAVFEGTDLAVFLDGVRILQTSGITPGGGRVGPFAMEAAVVEFDDLAILRREEIRSGVIAPLRLPIAQVGQSYEAGLSCLGPADDDRAACTYDQREGSLPAGLRLERDGRIVGTPREPFDGPLTLSATRGRGRATTQNVRLEVEAVSWPRFPFVSRSRVVPHLAVLYTPDDISQNATLEKLGAPDRLLFRLHADHPELTISMMSCPANRYIRREPLASQPKTAETWRRLALDPEFDWIELGGHGYTHSPDGDDDLDHHEFSVTQSGCNVDHSLLQDPEYCRRRMSAARASYRAAGIPDDRVIVMRFPGHEDNPEALRAAVDAGFFAILGVRHTDQPGREWWIPHPGGEILEIQNTSLLPLIVSEDLEWDLASEAIAPSEVTGSAEFRKTFEMAMKHVDAVASRGGILNLFNHWWETFEEIGGAMPRYLLFDALLDGIRRDYPDRVWYTGARDLALWLDARRFAVVSWKASDQGLTLQIEPPAHWATLGLGGLDRASLRARLPVGCSHVDGVRAVTGGTSFALDGSDHWVESGSLAVTFPMTGPVRLQIDCSG